MVGYKAPPSIEKSRIILAAFEAKVTILEGWARHGVPEEILQRARKDGSLSGDDLPRHNAKLRRWRGPEGDIEAWSYPMIDRPVTGKHPELAARFQAAIEGIDHWLARKRGRLAALETEAEVLKAENTRLRVQNMDLLGQVQQLKEDLKLSKSLEAEPQR